MIQVRKTQAGECILCMKCQDICPTGAVRFTPKQPPEQEVQVNLHKERFYNSMRFQCCCSTSPITELSEEEEQW